MSEILPICDFKTKLTEKIIEWPIIKDKALQFNFWKPHKNLTKKFQNGSITLNYEDLVYYIKCQEKYQEKDKITDYSLVAIYWQLTSDKIDFTCSDTTKSMSFNIDIKNDKKSVNGRQPIIRESSYFSIMQPYLHLSSHFTTNDIFMYSFALSPEVNENTGSLKLNDKTSISIKIIPDPKPTDLLNNLITNESDSIGANIIVQYLTEIEFNKFVLNKYLIPCKDFANFMVVLGQSTKLNLLSNKSLEKTFGKLDKYLIVEICNFLF